MERYLIEGGNKLFGEVTIESAKNSVLPLIASSILTEKKVLIKNCPKILDVFSLIKIVESIGVKTEFIGNDLLIDSSSVNSFEIPENLTKELRASVFMMGALISRFKRVKIAYPGGCNIGKRPIDLHLKCLRALGVKVVEKDGFITCVAERLKGNKIYLDYPSVGATENAILTAVLANGKTEIHNSAREPEIVDLMNFLNLLGAKIYGAGTSNILIEGVKKLNGGTYSPIFDRVEAGTFMLAVAITGGELQLNNCNIKNISFFTHKFCDNTCKMRQENGIIHVYSKKERKPFSISTGPYPDFPTDLQAQTCVLASITKGRSVICERVFENRFNHLIELEKMGAQFSVKGRKIIFDGVERLKGAHVLASDLRGGAALVLAGLNAEGQTVVDGVKHVKRGYANLDKKLRDVGANIKITEDANEG